MFVLSFNVIPYFQLEKTCFFYLITSRNEILFAISISKVNCKFLSYVLRWSKKPKVHFPRNFKVKVRHPCIVPKRHVSRNANLAPNFQYALHKYSPVTRREARGLRGS